jgi:polyhydroxyalkanoate synthase
MREDGGTMPDQPKDPFEWLASFYEAAQQVVQPLVAGTPAPGAAPDPYAQFTAMAQGVVDLQRQYIEQAATIWGALVAPGGAAAAGADKRFAADAWRDDPRFDLLKRAYLAYSDLLLRSVESAAVDDTDKGQLRFAMRQLVDAMSPANFLATNPEALHLALETGGASLTAGMALLLQDLAKGRISMTDEGAFEVGRNIAVTEGTVIFRNELIELIQYAPRTKEVHERPLVIIPPCINKYYILDLTPENSFVRHAVDQGHTVFMLSWRNIGADTGGFTWDDYLRLGVMKAIDVARAVTKVDEVNALGFCIGGTLLASATAVMKVNAEEKVASMTLLTTMLDFAEPGEIGALINGRSVELREEAIGQGGVMEGSELALTFSSLRANDLIWPYVVNSYLKGRKPPPFDLLYWNSDGTNLPGPMFCWYVRNTYLENALREPGRTIQCGVPVDLSDLDMPAFVYASRDDHIVPWRSAYASVGLLTGEVTFLLGASGHIAGVINPPAKARRNFWYAGDYGGDADHWLATAQEEPGSWWPTWAAWLAEQAGDMVPAPAKPGNKKYRPLGPAPGEYVKVKAS